MRISDWSSDVCSSDLASSIIDLHDGRKVANEWAGATPPTTQGDAFMATDQKTLVVHPGDIIQGTTKDSRGGHFFMVSQCKAWGVGAIQRWIDGRSEEHTSELQSLMRISYAVFCLKKNKIKTVQIIVD